MFPCFIRNVTSKLPVRAIESSEFRSLKPAPLELSVNFAYISVPQGLRRFRYLSSSLRSSSLHVRYRITQFATYHNRVRYLSLTLLTSKKIQMGLQ